MNICVIGLGYVGVVSAACFADMGHRVTGVDIEKKKVEMLNAGKSPIIEPGLDELIEKGVKSGRLKADLEFANFTGEIDTFFVCVGTPSNANGDVNLQAVKHVSEELRNALLGSKKSYNIIYRSTVPPGTMQTLVHEYFKDSDHLKVAYHPEFLREGSALDDFHSNPQVVASNLINYTQDSLDKLFRDLYRNVDYRFYSPNIKASEGIKYVNNTFHALKVAFANEIGRFCNAEGIPTDQLMEIFLDDDKLNISRAYLKPGFAYGGSCLPKDLRALNYMARHADLNLPIVENIEASNELHIDSAFLAIERVGLKKIGISGLTFKENTDDVRESPYVKLTEKLIGKGYDVKIYDKYINTKLLMGKNLEYLNLHIPHITKRLVKSEKELYSKSELLVISQVPQLAPPVDMHVIYLNGNKRTDSKLKKEITIV